MIKLALSFYVIVPDSTLLAIFMLKHKFMFVIKNYKIVYINFAPNLSKCKLGAKNEYKLLHLLFKNSCL